MNKYEVAVVVSAQLADEERAAVVEQVKEDWGKRRLAYEIAKQSEGYYYFVKCEAESSMSVALEQDLRIMENVLRYLIVREGE